ncbi:hypothetical protein COO60DRAFT_1584941 [Scenedesmus sp. NREL 46B-D3]|nr:hypothetical protein COO60DRAFT_1584941 [Scenedesmus sp. NREL 46B-D3]
MGPMLGFLCGAAAAAAAAAGCGASCLYVLRVLGVLLCALQVLASKAFTNRMPTYVLPVPGGPCMSAHSCVSPATRASAWAPSSEVKDSSSCRNGKEDSCLTGMCDSLKQQPAGSRHLCSGFYMQGQQQLPC